MRDKGRGERSTLSGNGRVSLSRRRWQGAGGGAVVPADAWLDAAGETVSRGARELCGRMGVESRSFARAAEAPGHVGQLGVSTELLRRVVEEEGRAAPAAADPGELKPGWQAKDCLAKTPAGKEVSRAYPGMDGFTAPLLTEAEKGRRREQVVAARARRPKDKPKPKPPPLPRRKRGADQRYKEFKLVQSHGEDMAHRLISVTRGDCREAGRVMRRDADRVAFAGADDRVANVDGGPWVVNLLLNRAVVLTATCLDFYHLSRHVNEAKRATFGEGGEAGKQWAGEVLHEVRHNGYGPFPGRLIEWRRPLRGAKRAEADRLIGYAAAREDMIVYDRCRKNGWRISSSTTGSECGAVPARVKGGGKRRDGDNAEAMMALEAVKQSDLWNQYRATRACLNN